MIPHRFRDEKNFGFVRVDGVKGDVFFHGSSVASNVALAPGMRVRVRVGVDNRGRRRCDAVEAVEGSDTVDEVERPVFSMNMPFAGLVAHGLNRRRKATFPIWRVEHAIDANPTQV